MANISVKEHGLIKGALSRVFSRSDLRKDALEAARVQHSDPLRPRVMKWYKCAGCPTIDAGYKMDVDHIEPKIPVTRRQIDLTVQELADRIFCQPSNLQVLCEVCHNAKSKIENAQRRANFPKPKKPSKSKKKACAKA